MIGKMIKVDRSTSIYEKGGFARICVEIDLKKPLLPTYKVFGEERSFVYEGLHQVCFSCGKYGHTKVDCPLVESPVSQEAEQATSGDLNAEINSDLRKGKESNPGVDGGASSEKDLNTGITTGEKLEKSASVTSKGVVGGEKLEEGVNAGDAGGLRTEKTSQILSGGTSVVTGGEGPVGTPFGKLRILRRDFLNGSRPDQSRKVFNGDQSLIGNQKRSVEDQRDLRQLAIKSEFNAGSIRNKGDVSKSKEATKSEWVQVGSKRKNVSKIKSKGKENFPPANRLPRKSTLGLGLEPNTLNAFSILQDPVAHVEGLVPSCSNGPHDLIKRGGREEVAMSEKLVLGPAIESLKENCIPMEDSNQEHRIGVFQDSISDVLMCVEDKALGEVAIPQHNPIVSQ
ncbi:hypothetical protein K1719_024718 [Acacia pycnantha]|nr:hypothetical protein K1719_024718 [Acacia pycnantha]